MASGDPVEVKFITGSAETKLRLAPKMTNAAFLVNREKALGTLHHPI